jgi:hypothetical protein
MARIMAIRLLHPTVSPALQREPGFGGATVTALIAVSRS